MWPWKTTTSRNTWTQNTTEKHSFSVPTLTPKEGSTRSGNAHVASSSPRDSVASTRLAANTLGISISAWRALLFASSATYRSPNPSQCIKLRLSTPVASSGWPTIATRWSDWPSMIREQIKPRKLSCLIEKISRTTKPTTSPRSLLPSSRWSRRRKSRIRSLLRPKKKRRRKTSRRPSIVSERSLKRSLVWWRQSRCGLVGWSSSLCDCVHSFIFFLSFIGFRLRLVVVVAMMAMMMHVDTNGILSISF